MGRIVVTGAFGYIGGAVARELLGRGAAVHSLTGRRPVAGSPVTAAPLLFEREHLVRELRGADAFVNTFWVRLPEHGLTFDEAVERSRLLLESAAEAGVRRIVHVSVSNAAMGRNLGYYDGKARVEEVVRRLDASVAIVRPTLVVGRGDVLTGNIAWLLRRFPFFMVPEGGRCRLQPVTLDDTARLIADLAQRADTVEVDAAGPRIFTFGEYVETIASACGLRRSAVSVPGWVALLALRLVGRVLGDVVLAREEWLGLKQELLLSGASPAGQESVSDWLKENGPDLGRRYVHDWRRHCGADRFGPVNGGS